MFSLPFFLDQIGPATVPMVSPNGPPHPMPLQVPPGHIVQQVIDEQGTLRHVILSLQQPQVYAPATTAPTSTPSVCIPV